MVLNKTLLLIIVSFFTYNAKGQIDTLRNEVDSLNYNINSEVTKFINSKPPVIYIDLYVDGIKVEKKYFVRLSINGKSVKKTKSKKIKLTIFSFKSEDSISFSLIYDNNTICSNNFSYKRFIHGGNLIFGIVHDYSKEKGKYFSDITSYFENNQKNYLYDILGKATKNDKGNQKNQLLYCIVKSNTTAKINFKFEFR